MIILGPITAIFFVCFSQSPILEDSQEPWENTPFSVNHSMRALHCGGIAACTAQKIRKSRFLDVPIFAASSYHPIKYAIHASTIHGERGYGGTYDTPEKMESISYVWQKKVRAFQTTPYPGTGACPDTAVFPKS